MNFKLIPTFIFIICTLPIISQTTDLALGQWKSHLPFNTSIDVTQSDETVYFATELAVLAVDKAEFSFERLTKVELLSNVGIRTIEYNKGSDVLMVVYNDGIIDLISDEGNLTVFSIQDSDIILGEKRVEEIFMVNDSIAYLAANWGVTEFNVVNGKSPATVRTPFPVFTVSVYENMLYAGTEQGIYRISLTGQNIDDFNNWELLDTSFGFPEEYFASAMAIFNGQLYLGINDDLYAFDGTDVIMVNSVPEQKLQFISADGNRLIAGFQSDNVTFDSEIYLLNADGSFEYAPRNCARLPNHAIEDETGQIWLADGTRPFRRLVNGTGSCSEFEVASPLSKNVSELAIGEDQFWIASGGVEPENFTALGNNEGFFSFIDGEWQVYSKFFEPFVSSGGIWDDFYTIKIHPETGDVYTGSFTGGLSIVDKEQNVTLINHDNSSLQQGVGTGGTTRVSGLAFDDQNNLWVSNHLAPEPLSVLTNEGVWKSFKPSQGDNSLMDIAIDAFGYKWMKLSTKTLGVVVFDEGDLDDPSDDRSKVLTTSNSNLPSNEIRSLETDLDGNVWVGTKVGPIVFECSVLDSDCPGSIRIVEQDNFGALLLENEDILTIAVDGANRKWFGTTNGIFVQSPSGEDQIARFTTENSPLFDNTIQDIVIDPRTGEVYIATNEGLQVYRGEATVGERFHRNLTVFPNPVRPDYNGPIAIKGLAQDANVKITDVRGQLVFETTALGGQAIWDGRDYTGRKANTGVYLVFSTSDNTTDPDTAVGKILFVN